MSIRRMMLFTLGAKIKNLIDAFKTRVLATQGEFEAESCLEAQLTELDNDNLLDNASLVVTPNGYKENLLYSVVSNTTIGDMSVTRATTATRVNADGFIEQVPYNLFQRSEEFENAIWFKTGTLITPNTTIAPNNLLTASKVALTNGTDPLSPTGVGLAQNQTIPSGVYVYSIFAKAGERNIIRWRDGGFSGNYLVVNLLDGTFTNGQPTRFVNTQVIPYDNGWYRIIFTTGTITNPSAYPLRFGTTGQIGDGISGGFVWGAQLVTGSSAKDYFPTTNRFNIPRIDYSNGSCPSILVEPQRTNVALRSEEFNDATWLKIESSIVANSTTSPSGVQNADSFIENTATALHQCSFQSSATSGIYTATIYAKPNGRNWLFLNIAAAANYGAWFDIQNGVVGTVQSNITSASITNAGNGWYRCTLTANTGALLPRISLTLSTGNNNLSYLGNGTSGVFIWGAQLEAGPNATSYIPTTTAAVTRNADVITNTNLSTLIGQTEGSVYLDFFYPSGITTGVELFSIYNSSSSYLIRFRVSSGTGNVFSSIYNNSGIAENLIPTFTITPNTRVKIAVVYDYATKTSKVFRNGFLIGSTTGVQAYPTAQDKINVGGFFGINAPSYTNQITIWKTKLTDTQAINLTIL
jgi:hypothetical protein